MTDNLQFSALLSDFADDELDRLLASLGAVRFEKYIFKGRFTSQIQCTLAVNQSPPIAAPVLDHTAMLTFLCTRRNTMTRLNQPAFISATSKSKSSTHGLSYSPASLLASSLSTLSIIEGQVRFLMDEDLADNHSTGEIESRSSSSSSSMSQPHLINPPDVNSSMLAQSYNGNDGMSTDETLIVARLKEMERQYAELEDCPHVLQINALGYAPPFAYYLRDGGGSVWMGHSQSKNSGGSNNNNIGGTLTSAGGSIKIPASTLAELLWLGQMNQIERKFIAFQLIKAVQSMHAKGISHGHLCPENILVTPWRWAWLTDLGSTFRPFKPSLIKTEMIGEDVITEDPACFHAVYYGREYNTENGGQVCYLAPEQLSNCYVIEESNSVQRMRADVFSLALIVEQLLCDQHSVVQYSVNDAIRGKEPMLSDPLAKRLFETRQFSDEQFFDSSMGTLYSVMKALPIHHQHQSSTTNYHDLVNMSVKILFKQHYKSDVDGHQDVATKGGCDGEILGMQTILRPLILFLWNNARAVGTRVKVMQLAINNSHLIDKETLPDDGLNGDPLLHVLLYGLDPNKKRVIMSPSKGMYFLRDLGVFCDDTTIEDASSASKVTIGPIPSMLPHLHSRKTVSSAASLNKGWWDEWNIDPDQLNIQELSTSTAIAKVLVSPDRQWIILQEAVATDFESKQARAASQLSFWDCKKGFTLIKRIIMPDEEILAISPCEHAYDLICLIREHRHNKLKLILLSLEVTANGTTASGGALSLRIEKTLEETIDGLEEKKEREKGQLRERSSFFIHHMHTSRYSFVIIVWMRQGLVQVLGYDLRTKQVIWMDQEKSCPDEDPRLHPLIIHDTMFCPRLAKAIVLKASSEGEKKTMLLLIDLKLGLIVDTMNLEVDDVSSYKRLVLQSSLHEERMWLNTGHLISIKDNRLKKSDANGLGEQYINIEDGMVVGACPGFIIIWKSSKQSLVVKHFEFLIKGKGTLLIEGEAVEEVTVLGYPKDMLLARTSLDRLLLLSVKDNKPG